MWAKEKQYNFVVLEIYFGLMTLKDQLSMCSSCYVCSESSVAALALSPDINTSR